MESRRRPPTRAITALFAVVLGTAPACGSARVVPRGEVGTPEAERLVFAEGDTASLLVTGRPWTASPQHVLVRHTTLWIEITNRSDAPLRFRPEDFYLSDGEQLWQAVSPVRLVDEGRTGSTGEARIARTEGLRAATLSPGQYRRGYLFFDIKFAGEDQGRSVTLQGTLFDDGHAEAIEHFAVPLVVAY